MKHTEDSAYKYTENRTVDEIIERLRDGILQREAYLRDCFLCYNKQAGGKLSKTDFHKVIFNFIWMFSSKIMCIACGDNSYLS